MFSRRSRSKAQDEPESQGVLPKGEYNFLNMKLLKSSCMAEI